jgi:hypothetical protein
VTEAVDAIVFAVWIMDGAKRRKEEKKKVLGGNILLRS